MCRFTSRSSPAFNAATEGPKEKFAKAETILQYICDQMEQVLLKISDLSVRLERAGPLSAAGASLEIQLQVLQGVYAQMYEVAGQKAEQLEQLHQLI